MKLSTTVTIPASDVSVEHQNPILLIGSCFSQNIGKKLIENKFDVNQVNAQIIQILGLTQNTTIS